ncbi:MAG: type I polyketide synthase, partial [Microcystaceae cyanobacterium]
MSSPQIAIVGMACLYPDAHSPQELWENVLSQRRAFRKLPSERLSLNDYYSPDKTIPDAIYSQKAAVIEGYEFDRIAYKVVGSTFRSADLAHWLALDIASQALHDADFTDGKDLPKETTGVLLGNTLTGELSRANTLRLRWPYVHHRVEDQLIKQGLSAEERQIFLNELEKRFKEPFEPIGEESLAGNLANTIAGRICNYFDLKGSGYIVDGACSSSLLAVANGCSALMAEDLDVALVGGVDISIDPFELVGFAKTGALASGEMKVYDQASNGFIPGEGCGFLVLMRHEDALAQNKRIYAVIQGWGISSDGKGGITRPEVEGQLFALNRAYKRAKFTGDTIAYFEGHGTGTAVGDATELEVLSRIHSDAENKAAISSIKANIGHTKAAAGIAGLIKATMAVHRQIIPPMTGCDRPHAKLTQDSATLQVLKEGQIWPNSLPLRAAVSAMGFGGINSHIIIEGLSQIRRHSLTLTEQSLIHSPQDAELFLFSSNSKEDLQEQVNQLLNIVPRISQSEMTDLAIELAKKVNPHLPHRLGIIASSPDTLTNRLVDAQALHLSQDQNNIFINSEKQINKIVFLFPGQAAPVYLNGGLWERRFPEIKQLYNNAQLPKSKNNIVTNIAQPAIVTASLAGLHLLESLNIKADLAIGHSLGELCALYWAKAYDETQLINIAKVRGQAMAQLGSPTGKMASINADADTVRGLLNGRIVKIAGLNSPYQTIVSGEDLGVKDVIEKAQNKDIKTVYLPVSHAFHSPLVAQAVQPLEYYLQQSSLNSLQKTVISTVTGEKLPFETNWRSLLLEQITSPVRFMDAVKVAEKEVDLFIEVGSGSILSRLVKDITDIPVISLDSGSESLQGLLKAVAVMFVNGVKVNYQGLFEDRFSRPFNLDYQPRFIANPCEMKAEGRGQKAEGDNNNILVFNSQTLTPNTSNLTPDTSHLTPNTSHLEVVRQLVAQKTELPIETIENGHRLLGDLHLNSISVSQLVIEAARQLDLSPPHSP